MVAGSSIAGPGKRPDAVLRTAGRIRSMVLVEVKHHLTALLCDRYRQGTWPPSKELSEAVSQSQVTLAQPSKSASDFKIAAKMDPTWLASSRIYSGPGVSCSQEP